MPVDTDVAGGVLGVIIILIVLVFIYLDNKNVR